MEVDENEDHSRRPQHRSGDYPGIPGGASRTAGSDARDRCRRVRPDQPLSEAGQRTAGHRPRRGGKSPRIEPEYRLRDGPQLDRGARRFQPRRSGRFPSSGRGDREVPACILHREVAALRSFSGRLRHSAGSPRGGSGKDFCLHRSASERFLPQALRETPPLGLRPEPGIGRRSEEPRAAGRMGQGGCPVLSSARHRDAARHDRQCAERRADDPASGRFPIGRGPGIQPPSLRGDPCGCAVAGPLHGTHPLRSRDDRGAPG